MEFQKFSYDEEIVLTYRPQQEPEEVKLRYERELPARMQGVHTPPPPMPIPMPPVPPVPPYMYGMPEPKKKRRSVWKTVIAIILCVSIGIGCTGFGVWCVANAVINALDMEQDSNNQFPVFPNDGEDSMIPDSGEADGGIFDIVPDNSGAPEIDSFRPEGSSPRLKLVSVGSNRQPLTAAEVYAKVSPSTVTVLGNYNTDTYSVGTGIIFTADGYIVTNYHVIAGCSGCTVWVTDEYGADITYEAKFVGGDEQKDLAVLKIDATGLPAAEFGISSDLVVGDKVYAIGNPLGTELRGTFTDGIVSAVDRNVEVDGVTMTLVQTNAALNHGNSGGPLINSYGQVVGINTIKMMSGEDTIEGLGFAIPTSHAVRWINEILDQGFVGPSPILGLSVTNIPVKLPDGNMGLEVVEIVSGLSAHKAGVQVGDVVVGFNGAVIRSTDDIYAERIKLSVGDVVTIRVYRNGEYLDLTMKMMAPSN